MDTSASNRRLRLLLLAIKTDVLIPRPDFQRRLVWNNRDKCQFIRTVLDGFPFPEIYIAAGSVDTHTGEGTEVLVDGQQRMTSLYQYFTDSGDLKLPSDIKRFNELEEKDRLDFLEYKVVVRDLGSMPIGDIKEVFQRINSTAYGLNAMELNNSRYAGSFKQLAEWMTEHELFEKYRLFSASDIRRMGDVKFCLGILSTILGGYFNRDRELEDYLAKYDEEIPDEVAFRERILSVFSLIDRMNFPSDSRVGKKADFFTLFVEVYESVFTKKVKVEPSIARRHLDEFYSKVDATASGGSGITEEHRNYYKATLQASNDRTSRILRGGIVSKLLILK